MSVDLPSNEASKPSRDYFLANNTYDILKNLALYLPILSALYYGLGLIWGFPKADEIVGSIAVIGVALTGIIKIGDKTYENSETRYDGSITVPDDASEFDGKKRIEMKVVKVPAVDPYADPSLDAEIAGNEQV